MKKIIFPFLLLLLIASCQPEKTAFVDTEKLLKEYQGAKDLETQINARRDSIQSGLQQLQQEFRIKLQDYQVQAPKMSASQREQKEQELMAQQSQIQELSQREGQSFQSYSGEKMDTLVAGIKKFVAEYAKNNGYTYIFGSNPTTENILYGDSSKNLTDEVLKALNEAYKPE